MKWMAMLRDGLLLGSVVATAACGDAETSAPACMESPGIVPLESINGQGGTNGMDSSSFHAYFLEFEAMTKIPLAQPGMNPVNGVYPLNPLISDGFLKSGKDASIRDIIFAKAMQCALPRKTSKPEKEGVSLKDNATGKTYMGGGLMGTATTWLTEPLKQPAVEDVVTCMILLLNPNYQGIPVFLAGPSVSKDDPVSADEYPFEEAIWSADVGEAMLQFHVWPLFKGPQFPSDCSSNPTRPEAPWEYRVCGSSSTDCNVDVRFDRMEEECEEVVPEGASEGEVYYVCAAQTDPAMPAGPKKPAVKTRLKTKCDLNALFCLTAQ